MALPNKMEPAIIMPGEMLSSSTSKAPRPNMRDCKDTAVNLVQALIMPAFSLASACRLRNLLCSSYQRACKFCSIPMASMTSALRKLFVARELEATAIELASASGL